EQVETYKANDVIDAKDRVAYLEIELPNATQERDREDIALKLRDCRNDMSALRLQIIELELKKQIDAVIQYSSEQKKKLKEYHTALEQLHHQKTHVGNNDCQTHKDKIESLKSEIQQVHNLNVSRKNVSHVIFGKYNLALIGKKQHKEKILQCWSHNNRRKYLRILFWVLFIQIYESTTNIIKKKG
ncbi:hypothetical protein RFI_00754, partial [Reticulomyxa filosa]